MIASPPAPLTSQPLERHDLAKTKPTKSVIQCQLKLRLTCAQKAQLRRYIWHLTAVYNWTIRTAESDLNRTGRLPSAYDLRNRLKGVADRIDVPIAAMEGTVFTARTAWNRYLAGLAGKPRLKGQRRPLNSVLFSHGLGRWNGGRPYLPRIGSVRIHRQDIPVGRFTSGRIVRRASGWYLCLFIKAAPKAIKKTSDGCVGIDPGFTSLLTLSTGEAVDVESELKAGAMRLAQAQRGDRKRLTARLQERIANRRKNRNHHLSRRLVSENSLIAFSKDQTAKIARRFGKSVASAGHSQLRSMLRYKSSLTGGTSYIEVPCRNSTRTCHECGALTGPQGLAGLSVRFWECSGCGSQHERDRNAALVTLKIGLGMSQERSCEAAS